MLAARARTPLVLAAVALGSTLLADRLVPPPGHRPAMRAPVLELHVKLRAPGLPLVTAAYDGMRIEPMFDAAETDPALGAWLVVTAAGERAALLADLAADPAVAEAFVAPDVALPTVPPAGAPDLLSPDARAALGARGTAFDDGDACPIHTPSFESYQGYLGPAPGGIDAPAAWRRGLRGQGMWFADIEGGWNAQHEDLPGARITHVGGSTLYGWSPHGTAVLGEVVGANNSKGVVGIAPDVERVFTSSIGGTSVANAIDRAARALRPGDVLLIELQTSGPRRGWIPVEYYDDIYDVIRLATARGVVVIEAAGNGAEDLDHADYRGKFDRRRRDSGAILVGAGAPAREGFADRERLDFSNYGSRVDVQGWGRRVATLDYGDLQRCDSETNDRHYTDRFSGTSSASPIVAGAALLVEQRASRRLSPAEVRELLRATGTPQAGNTAEQIGPRPDLAQALAR